MYEILEPYIDGLFFPLKEKDYTDQALNSYITLCNENKEMCDYPCTDDNGKCKLYVREKDSYGNLLIEKIKWNFIEKLLITGMDDRMDIIEEKVNLNELKNSINFDEIFYTYSEYKEGKLDEIFKKRSKYIQQFGENKIVKKRHSIMKKMDSIPYYIQRLYGKEASVLFHLNYQLQ